MPTARSSTETRPRVEARARVTTLLRDQRWAVADVGHLVRFRAGTLRRRRLVLALTIVLGLTAATILIAATAHGAGHTEQARNALVLMPTAFAAFQLLQLVSGVASGGGRELAPRDQLVAYPVSPTTDHLGALLLAPLNISWMIQTWVLLGAAAYGVGLTGRLLPLVIGVLLWVAGATAVGQVIAWGAEGLRRLPYGVALVRSILVLGIAAFAVLQGTGRLVPWLDRLPTRWFVVRLAFGFDGRWALAVLAQLALLVVATAVGAVPAHLAARLQPRDELRAESGTRPARRLPGSDFAMLLRIDRASVWRAVPMRRGLVVLSLGPGLIALAAAAPWSDLIVMPGLVASGAALLFGVNAWCLDERGGLWRESLPVGPRLVFAARTWVLAEFMLAAAFGTLAVGALRAPRPTLGEVAAALTACLVVTAQAGVAGMRWSQRTPYSVDLRSARATPAPPLAMIGYSSRLAVVTALTGVALQLLARTGAVVPVLVGVAILCWQASRLLRVCRGWEDPVTRARVVTTVAL